MNPADQTPPGATDAVVFEWHLPHPPTKVWRALTDPALLARWLLPVTGFRLDPGTPFVFQAPPQATWNGEVHCQLLEALPPARLVWSWEVGDLQTVVTFTLTPSEAGCQLGMVQTGFMPNQKQNFGGARWGWAHMGAQLQTLLPELK